MQPHNFWKYAISLSALLFRLAEAAREDKSPQLKASWRPSTGRACTDDPFYAADGKTCDMWKTKTCGNANGDNTNLTSSQSTLLAACPDACADASKCLIGQISFATMTVYNPQSTAPQAASMYVDDFMSLGGFVANNESATIQLLELAGETDSTIQGHTRFLASGQYPSVIIGPGNLDLFRQAADIVENTSTLLLSTFIGDETVFQDHQRTYGIIRPYPKLLQPVFQLLAKVQPGAYVSMVCPSVDRGLTRNSGICEVMPKTISDNDLLFLKQFDITSNDHSFMEDQDYSKEPDLPEDLSSFAKNLTQARPDIILCLDTQTVCSKIVFALREILYSPPLAIILVDDGTVDYFLDAVIRPDESYWRTIAGIKRLAAAELLQDVLLVSDWDRSGYDQTITEPKLTEIEPVVFNELFKQQFGFAPTFESASTYVALAAMMKAYQAAANYTGTEEGETPTSIVDQYLIDVTGDSLYGYFSFDDFGQIATNASTMQIDVQPEGTVPRVKMRVVTPTKKALQDARIPFPSWEMKACSQSALYPLKNIFYCIDSKGKCVNCQHGYKRQVNKTTGSFDCKICPAGTLQANKESNQEPICQPCVAGEYNDRPGQARESMENQKCKQCRAGRFSNNSGASTCRECPAGTYSSADGSTSCQACRTMMNNKQLVYSYSPPGSSMCTPCPKGGVCLPDRNNLITNFTSDEGYFLDNAKKLIACIHGNGRACFKQSKCYTNEKGFRTMSGPYCGSCEPACARVFPSDLCEQCPSQSESIAGVFVQLLALLFFPSILMTVSLLTDFDQPADIALPVLKQFVNYVSMASVVALSSGSTSIVSKGSIIFVYCERLLGLSEMGTPLLGLAPPCLTQYFKPDIEFYRVEIVLAFMWLPLNVIGAFLLSLPYNALAHLFRGRLVERQHLVLWFTINVFCFLPRITTLITRAWDCRYFDTYRLLWNTNILCMSEGNIWSSAGTVGVFLISFGTPVLLLFFLYRYNRFDSLKTPEIATALGFLYAGFESDHYYFECIFMVRKVLYRLLTKIPGLGGAESDVTDLNYGTTILVLATFCYGFHRATTPFDDRAYFLLDRIESASVQAILIMAALQVWVLSTEKAETFRLSESVSKLRDVICLIIIIACHIRFLALVLWAVLRPLLVKWIEARAKRGVIEVRRDGFIFVNLQPQERTLVETMFAEMARFHIHILQRFTVGGVLASLQHISLECDKVHQLRDLIHTRTVLRRFVPRIQRTQSFTEKEVFDSKDTASYQPEKHIELERQLDLQIKKLQGSQVALTQETLTNAVGKQFTTEDIFDALLRLGIDICRHETPAELSEKALKQSGEKHKQSIARDPEPTSACDIDLIVISDQDAATDEGTQDVVFLNLRVQLMTLREDLQKAQARMKESQESTKTHAALYQERRQACASEGFAAFGQPQASCNLSIGSSESQTPSEQRASSQPQEVPLETVSISEAPKVDTRSPTNQQAEELAALKTKLQSKMLEAKAAQERLDDLTVESSQLKAYVNRYITKDIELFKNTQDNLSPQQFRASL